MEKNKIGLTVACLLCLTILSTVLLQAQAAKPPPPSTAQLSSQNPQTNGGFGTSVAVGDGYVVVGAPYETVDTFSSAGRAYVFNTSGTCIAALNDSNPDDNRYFGTAVAIGGGYVFVGEDYGSYGGYLTGLVYAYAESGISSSSTPAATLTPPGDPSSNDGSGFGVSVATDGTYVVVGADYWYNSSLSAYVGRAYVYTLSDLTATPVTLNSTNPVDEGYFGSSVSVDKGNVVVGASHETVGITSDAGRVYVFSASTGAPVTTLTSPSPIPYGAFGNSVAIHGRTIVVGEPGQTFVSPTAGTAYLFTTSGKLTKTLTSPNPHVGGRFGDAVAIDDRTVVVGAISDHWSGYTGIAYVYTPTGKLTRTLASLETGSGYFGECVATDGRTHIVVGAPDETVTPYTWAGHAYIFYS